METKNKEQKHGNGVVVSIGREGMQSLEAGLHSSGPQVTFLARSDFIILLPLPERNIGFNV